MKSLLILVALLPCASWGALPKPQPPQAVKQTQTNSAPQPLPDARAVTLTGAATRHLNDAQRAELRMQLYQFNRSVSHTPAIARP
ncbi:MAG: hypothetical protein H7255_18120 [Ramlibacter sp.]|nr:hypothetical protein [Ramlibacter sp.]